MQKKPNEEGFAVANDADRYTPSKNVIRLLPRRQRGAASTAVSDQSHATFGATDSG